MTGTVALLLVSTTNVTSWPSEGVWLAIIILVLLVGTTLLVNLRGGRAATTEQTLDAPALPPAPDDPTAGEREPYDI